MDIQSASKVLDRDFTAFDTAKQGDVSKADGRISREDLQAVARNDGGRFTGEQQETARFLLDSETSRSFFDVGASRGSVDGTISRDDLNAAKDTLASGSYYDELLDTAAGRGGRDGNVSNDDIVAALSDPGVPQDLKNTLNLLLLAPQGSQGMHDVLKGLDSNEVAAASTLYGMPQFAALSGSDKRLVAEAMRDSGGDLAVNAKTRELLGSARFQSMTPGQRTAALTEIALVNTPQFTALPKSDQDLITTAVATARPDDLNAAASIKSLLESKDFAGLNGAEKTAVLSQVRNYPDSKVTGNIQRMLGKGWFKDFDIGDKQRALKLIAYMSYPRSGTNQTILDNTVEKFLAADATYSLKIESLPAPPGNVIFGNASDSTMRVNEDLISADNGKLENNPTHPEWATGLAVNTIPHEINHLINGDKVAPTYDYLNDEYRAWYVGYSAENGHPPSNKEALERWSYFVSPGGVYYDSAAKDALNNPDEAAKIFNELSALSGLKVDASNYKQVLADLASDTGKYKTDPNGPAVVPPGNLDNR
ncbi:MAG TPA: hypothetical protein VGC55_04655 [Dokdonella sp.]